MTDLERVIAVCRRLNLNSVLTAEFEAIRQEAYIRGWEDALEGKPKERWVGIDPKIDAALNRQSSGL